jgi:hypothetical protein
MGILAIEVLLAMVREERQIYVTNAGDQHMKIRQVLAFAALIIGLGTASVAKADTCAAQTVMSGLTCTVGDLTFAFSSVSYNPIDPPQSLTIATTSSIGGVTTLMFQLLSGTPVDVDIAYEVSSSSDHIVGLDSSFSQGAGSPAGSIVETACAINPVEGCPSNDLLANYTNNGGIANSAPFGPVGAVWINKDVTDNGFSEFTDSVEETTVTPEPSSIALFGTGLLAAAGALRRRLKA